METIKFYTVGCKVNQYETQNIREQFLRLGLKELEDGCGADLYMINTCTVTQHADADSLNLIRKARRQNPAAKIIVTGCLTELDEDKIKEADDQSIIIKNKDKENLLKLFFNHNELNELNEPDEKRGITYFEGHARAFLKIQDGCNNLCSYCKVPLARGRSRSRSPEEIIREAKALAQNGFKEIVLCGVCLGSYGKDLSPKISLVEIIAELERVEGLLRIRLSSIEAQDVSDKLIEKIAESQKLCRHLHIPLQSGDDEILKKMQRHYSRNDYLDLIKRIKQQVPQIAITTDVLVGFPTETEENFKNTVGVIKKITPLKVHIFPYSSRPATAATSFKQQAVPAKIIKKRVLYLKGIAEAKTIAYKKRFLNRKMPVLIEGRSKDNPGFWEGHTDNYIKVRVGCAEDLKNKIVPLRLKKISPAYLLADLSL